MHTTPTDSKNVLQSPTSATIYPGHPRPVGRLAKLEGEGGMSEQEPRATPDGAWAPPTGAPAPRPDPYAQFGNPLHDTWGKPSAQTSADPPPARVGKARKQRPGLRRAIAATVLVLLVIGGWFARDTLVDTWDKVYDKASDLSGDDGDTDDSAAGGSDTTATTTTDTDERLAELEAANDEAFNDWIDANRDELAGAVNRIDAVSADMVALNQAVASDDIIDLSVHRGTMVESRDATVAAVQVLDAAPESAIRNDLVTVLLLQASETGQMITASDAQDGPGVRAASLRFQRAGAETMRLCRQYGNRAGALCE